MSDLKIRAEGIFYHALKPAKPDDGEEIRQAVKCAFHNLSSSVHDGDWGTITMQEV